MKKINLIWSCLKGIGNVPALKYLLRQPVVYLVSRLLGLSYTRRGELWNTNSFILGWSRDGRATGPIHRFSRGVNVTIAILGAAEPSGKYAVWCKYLGISRAADITFFAWLTLLCDHINREFSSSSVSVHSPGFFLPCSWVNGKIRLAMVKYFSFLFSQLFVVRRNWFPFIGTARYLPVYPPECFPSFLKLYPSLWFQVILLTPQTTPGFNDYYDDALSDSRLNSFEYFKF